jgi:hypothetical protein
LETPKPRIAVIAFALQLSNEPFDPFAAGSDFARNEFLASFINRGRVGRRGEFL